MAAGVDVVFHCATAAPAAANTANKTLMHDVNVKGTQNIIEGCVTQGITKLVYTSSASVVFDGKDLFNVDEETPYAKNPIDFYTETKVSSHCMAQVLCQTLNISAQYRLHCIATL
jgi:sterol-4alpha-carboxylate 3-dehydrogenase (decarboxylating)